LHIALLGWYFPFLNQRTESEVRAVWGYEELVNNEQHFERLAELEPEALEIFEKMRRAFETPP
jgi:hypothetical protein